MWVYKNAEFYAEFKFVDQSLKNVQGKGDFFLFLFRYFIQYCSFAAPPLCWRMPGSNPGLLLLWHSQLDALTTRQKP